MKPIPTRPGYWLEQNCRMRPDGIYFDNDGNFYRPATKDEAQHGLNDTWPGDPVPVAKNDQRDKSSEAIVALKACVESMSSDHPGSDEYWRAVELAEAVIAKSEGH